MRKVLWIVLCICGAAFGQGVTILPKTVILPKTTVFSGTAGGGTPYTLDVHNVHDNGGATSTTAVVTVTGVTAGDLITCEESHSGASTFTSVADSLNAGNYSAFVADHKNTTISQFFGIYVHTSSASGNPAITLTTSSGTFAAIACQAWKPGSGSTQTQDGAALQQDLTATANPTAGAAATPAGSNELVICNLGTLTNTPTAGTNFTLIDAAATTQMFPQYWTQTTGTATNCPYTMGSDSWTDQQALIK